MPSGRFLGIVLCALVLAALPAAAQTLTAGIDVWTTPGDGSAYVDFTDNPLPAGFFCVSSQPFAQRITLKGSPIVTSPAGVLGSTDTVVERASDVDLGNGQGSTQIRVRAISFVNRTAISVPGCSDTFSAQVGLNGTAPAGSITISRSGAAGGTFDASFSVPGRITFTNNTTGQRLATPATETISLQSSGAPWADSVGSGGIAYPNPVSIDTNGDGVADYTTAGTTPGFAPGWSHGCNPPCPVKVDHNGPHPTWPLPAPQLCTSTATCYDGSTVSCSGNTCSAVDGNCDFGVRGSVTCNGVTSYCPQCPCDGTPVCCTCDRTGDCFACCRCDGGSGVFCANECG